ncbi:MAG: hypothetical protein M3328_02905 [Chloroflexota bacterium]|nr:hypothetical protein [Chloroflexota bacterium]
MELGWLTAAQGAGGLCGAFLVGQVFRGVGPARLVALNACALGLLFTVIVNVPWLPLTLALRFVAGAALAGLSIGVYTLLQGAAFNRYRGRVFGSFGTTNSLTLAMGLVLATALGDTPGTVPMLNLMSGLYMVAGVLAFALLQSRPTGQGAMQEQTKSVSSETPM